MERSAQVCAMKKINNVLVEQRYYILKELGSGGMSRVYKARDIFTRKDVALKKYETSDIANHERILEGIDREVTVLKNCTHPYLPKIFNFVNYNDSYYMVMEYICGEDLKKISKSNNKEFVKRNGRFKKKVALNIMIDVLSALYYLHSLEPPIVYRDLKPSNIIKTSEGVKLIDFGIAKRYSKDIANDKYAYGTKGFAAPEQFGNKNGEGLYNTDIRTDVYGVGATLYNLLCGKIYDPDIGISFSDKLIIGRGVSKIIKKATMIQPDRRYQNVLEMLCDIRNLI